MSAILQIIWKLVGPMLIDLAITTGLPAAMEWLYKKGLPQWLVDGILAIAKEALKQIGQLKNNPELSRAEVREGIRGIKKSARKAIKDKCSGTGCPVELK